ncbi:hypothetical protein AGMMS50212_10400 [Spirochaetia bacterium]|nr:hypothetical protein AGMMS50212_10400 [Spirochaetia bacterium]
MLVFLKVNILQIICTDDELVALGLGLADSSIGENNLLEWSFFKIL